MSDKTIVTSTESEPHLSTSIVCDSDSNDGFYEIPSEPPGPDYAQTIIAINDDDETDETTVIPSRFGVTSNDNEVGVGMFLSQQPGFEFMPSTT